MEQPHNETLISGQVVKLYPLKNTPNGIKIASFVVEHISAQIEAGLPRTVKCRLYCIIVGVQESQIEGLEQSFVTLSGFLSQNSKSQIVLNVKQIIDKGLKNVTSNN